MLALTKKTSYGLIAMAHLAKLGPDNIVSAREISELFGTPMSLLMNVLKELATAGYVQSIRGVRGGYRLARRPEEINLADLVTTLEGPIRLSACVTDQAAHRECTQQVMSRCPVADPVHRVQRRQTERNAVLHQVVARAHLPAERIPPMFDRHLARRIVPRVNQHRHIQVRHLQQSVPVHRQIRHPVPAGSAGVLAG